MRRVKRIAYVLLAATLMTVSALTPMETKAGSSEIILDGESLKTTNWNNPEGDVIVEEGKLVFPEESTDYTRFIAKTPIKTEESADRLVTFSATIKFNKLPQGQSFILGFGLTSIEAEPGDAGNIEVAFTNDGGIKAGVTAYNDEEAAEVLVAPKSSGMSVGKAAKVEAFITTDSKMEVFVNGSKIASATLPVNGEGRFGFLQTGECSVDVTNVELTHYEYDRPENTNIEEDFENGAMDVSKLTAKMIWTALNAPIGQYVTDYEGNQVLMHVNTGAAYIGTTYTYSNFEMTFDVPYMNIEEQYDEDGNLYLTAFNKLMVSIGGEKADWDSPRWDLVGEAIALEYGTVYSNSAREAYNSTLTKNPFEEGKPFSMQVKMVDSVLTIGMKWLEEENFQTVLQYKLKGGTPTGHIHIWAPTAACFAIDNLKITNLDDEANVIETEYRSGKIVVPEGKAPEALKKVYADVKQEGPSWYLLIPAAAVVGVVALAITAIATRSKKKEKEATINEQ